jgi:hypothetical protein
MKHITFTKNKTKAQIEAFKHNHREILKQLNLSSKQYNKLVFETGVAFLELFFDATKPEQAKWIKRFAQHHEYLFWNFWKAEWKVREHEFMLHCKLNNIQLNNSNWAQIHHEAVHCGFLEQSFRNFQKQLPCEL